MTVVSVETGADPNVLKLRTEDGSFFFVRDRYYPGPPPRPGEELSDTAEESLLRARACFDAERKAASLIARREHSRSELELKLRARGFARDAARQALDFLESEGLVDDRRFAEAYARYRAARRRTEGPALIELALRAKGVDRRTAAEAAALAMPAEEERAAIGRLLARDGGGKGERELSALLRGAGFSRAAVRDALGGRD